MPVSYSLVEASYSDLTPLHELSYELPPETLLREGKGYLSSEDQTSLQEACGIVLAKFRRKNTCAPHGV